MTIEMKKEFLAIVLFNIIMMIITANFVTTTATAYFVGFNVCLVTIRLHEYFKNLT